MDRNRPVKLRAQRQFVDSESDSDSVSSVESKQKSVVSNSTTKSNLKNKQRFFGNVSQGSPSKGNLKLLKKSKEPEQETSPDYISDGVENGDVVTAVIQSVLVSECRFNQAILKVNVVPYDFILKRVREAFGDNVQTALIQSIHKKLQNSYGNLKRSIRLIRSVHPYDYKNHYFLTHPSDALLKRVGVSREENNMKLDEYESIIDKSGMFFVTCTIYIELY